MCDNTWDQRIPNEPILARQFLLTQPPILQYPRPVSTTGTGKNPVGTYTNIPMTTSEATNLRSYMSGFTNRDPHSGLLVKDKGKDKVKDKDVKDKAKEVKHVNVNGSVLYNINADTEVKAYRPYRSKDCIPAESLPILHQQRLQSNARALTLMRASLIPAPGPVWDQNTSSKLRWVDPRV